MRRQIWVTRIECDSQLAGRYRDLVAAVDGYAMDMSALLFESKTFDLADDGTHAIRAAYRLPWSDAG